MWLDSGGHGHSHGHSRGRPAGPARCWNVDDWSRVSPSFFRVSSPLSFTAPVAATAGAGSGSGAQASSIVTGTSKARARRFATNHPTDSAAARPPGRLPGLLGGEKSEPPPGPGGRTAGVTAGPRDRAGPAGGRSPGGCREGVIDPGAQPHETCRPRPRVFGRIDRARRPMREDLIHGSAATPTSRLASCARASTAS
jgi:hypothetical protein